MISWIRSWRRKRAEVRPGYARDLVGRLRRTACVLNSAGWYVTEENADKDPLCTVKDLLREAGVRWVTEVSPTEDLSHAIAWRPLPTPCTGPRDSGEQEGGEDA